MPRPIGKPISSPAVEKGAEKPKITVDDEIEEVDDDVVELDDEIDDDEIDDDEDEEEDDEELGLEDEEDEEEDAVDDTEEDEEDEPDVDAEVEESQESINDLTEPIVETYAMSCLSGVVKCSQSMTVKVRDTEHVKFDYGVEFPFSAGTYDELRRAAADAFEIAKEFVEDRLLEDVEKVKQARK